MIPKIAQISHPLRPLLGQYSKSLRPLLRQYSKFVWTDTHEDCFVQVEIRMANATENCHCSPELETRVKCDASRADLGGALEQLTVEGWKPIAFTSRFLNSCQDSFSVNELELLIVVWSIGYFENYLYGKQF